MCTVPSVLDVPVPARPRSDVPLHRLTASLAHHVNNALTGVIGYLEMALQGPGAADAEAVRSGLECAHQAAEAVRRIVNCSRAMRDAAPPAAQSLRQLAEAAAERCGSAAGPVIGAVGPVVVSADLVGLALDGLLRIVGEAGPVRLCVADDKGRSALFLEGAGVADLPRRLLEASLMVEIQGGALEVLSAPGEAALLKLSFPTRIESPIRCDDAQSAPPSPHRPTAIALYHTAG